VACCCGWAELGFLGWLRWLAGKEKEGFAFLTCGFMTGYVD